MLSRATMGCVVGHCHLVYKICELADRADSEVSRTGIRVSWTAPGRADAVGPGGPTQLAVDALGSSWVFAYQRGLGLVSRSRQTRMDQLSQCGPRPGYSDPGFYGPVTGST